MIRAMHRRTQTAAFGDASAPGGESSVMTDGEGLGQSDSVTAAFGLTEYVTQWNSDTKDRFNALTPSDGEDLDVVALLRLMVNVQEETIDMILYVASAILRVTVAGEIADRERSVAQIAETFPEQSRTDPRMADLRRDVERLKATFREIPASPTYTEKAVNRLLRDVFRDENGD